MRKLLHLITAILGVGLLLQGTITLVLRLVPDLDRAYPAVLENTQMIVPHSLVHIASGFLAMAALFRSPRRGPFWFLLGFGAFYALLGFSGPTIGHHLGLGLQPFDHPFHIMIGSIALLAVALSLAQLPRSKLATTLTLLLASQLISLGRWLFYAWMEGNVGIIGLASFTAAVAILTLASLWLQKPWAAWAVLITIAFDAAGGAWIWAVHRDPLALFSFLISLVILSLLLRGPASADTTVSTSLKIYFGCVATLTLYVTFWGLLFPLGLPFELAGLPKNFDDALPFVVAVPPLHAQFIGALYLSATTFLVLQIVTTEHWAEIRVTCWMILIWTGLLGLISVLHLELFDWNRRPVWAWYIAYIGFPIVTAWVLWRQHGQREHIDGPPLSRALRWYLLAQGSLVTFIGLALLVAPATTSALWPWEIAPFLSQVYSAPFLAYGLSSLLAARQHTWAEARMLVYAALTFSVSALLVSTLHLPRFNFMSASAWIWYAGFSVAALALGAYSAIPALRSERSANNIKEPPMRIVYSTIVLDRIEDKRQTPIRWPLRIWLGGEILFAFAASQATFLFPQNATANFAWPISVAVMAAVLGVFYAASAPVTIWAYRMKFWQEVRVLVVPLGIFAFFMSLMTFLHWSQFSFGTPAFYVWMISYIVPPPLFSYLYWWHQRRSAPIGSGIADAIPNAACTFLRINGALLAVMALLVFAVPELLIAIGPWKLTPLTARTLANMVLVAGTTQCWMALEADWRRIKLGALLLILVAPGFAIQLVRFHEQVQWLNVPLWFLLLDSAGVAVLLLYLWVTAANRARSLVRAEQSAIGS